MNKRELYAFLEKKYQQYNNPEFIETDPISIPHKFSRKEDIEISAFLTSAISWGQRQSIIKNAYELVKRMEFSPYEFVYNCKEKNLVEFKNFVHRTFNGTDCIFFIKSLQNIYRNHGGLEKVFNTGYLQSSNVKDAIISFRKVFFELPVLQRTEKHISNPLSNSACKRLNMFLRWMVRKDKSGVDFGIWKSIRTKDLLCPLDVHSGNISRMLGLLKRKQNDWKAVAELTGNLTKFDPNDPVKYDFALFGTGAFEKSI